jgi:hypothetical protein
MGTILATQTSKQEDVCLELETQGNKNKVESKMQGRSTQGRGSAAYPPKEEMSSSSSECFYLTIVPRPGMRPELVAASLFACLPLQPWGSGVRALAVRSMFACPFLVYNMNIFRSRWGFRRT